MEPTQDIASPQDQSQPATDPLAIEQPGQPEPPPPPSAPETPSTTSVDPQPQNPQQPADASAQNESSTVESTSGESADKPAEPPAVDPLADVKPCESSGVEPPPEPSTSTTADHQDSSNTGVSSSDGPVEPKLPEPSSSEVPVEAAVPKPTTNDAPTSSNNSYVGSSSNCIKDPVTGDNSLKINGISDLSILDVTQGNDADEIEVKVEGGSLMHKVIKFSLLNGMQDSSKRLENSRLIMSGVSSTKTANGGEATLATTSSLSLGGGPLRQDDKAKEEGFKGGTLDSKTTPPACSSSGMRPESVEPGSSFSTSSNSSDSSGGSPANNGSEEVKPNRTEESRLRHSVDSNHSAESATPREESASDTFGRSASLDFREATTAAVAPKPPTPPTKETEPAAQPPQAEAKRPKAAMYYAELPDFSKPMFSAAPTTASTTSTAASTTTPSPQQQGRSLSQLQMKTPDFSRIVQAAAPPSAPQSAQPSSSISPAPSVSTSGSHRSHELQIANPDFSKSFGMASKPSSSEQSPYNMHPTSFAELSKQRNYISDLQLKNPSDPHPSVVKAGPSPPSTSGPSLTNFRIEKPQVSKPYPPYRQEPGPATQQLEEPKAHVIHKASTSSTPHPEPAKPWNPAVDYRAADRSRYPPQQYQKGPPPLTSEPPHPGPHSYQGYPQYPPSKGKEPPTQQQPPVAAHPGGIIVNNVKTYYPEPPQQQQPQQHQPPKSKDAEFRLDYKEKQLRQEGTIITLKQNERQPPAQHQQSYPPQPHSSYHRSRSPSAERREAQMMASSQEILYRDFKLKQSYEMPPSPASSSRSPAPVAPRDRSPYDPYYRGGPPSKYYPEQQQQNHQHHKQSPSPSATPSPTPMHSRNPSPVSKPVPPPPGQMHPPSSWPSQSRVVASPHGGGSANSSPQSASPNHYHPSQQKNSPSPVQQHAYQQPPGPGQHYKSPSPSSSSSPSPYGAGPVPPAAGPVTKYTQYYPSVNGERIVSIEVDKEQYKPGYKGLDFNMEQKFAEVYQAHQMKEKQGSTSSVRPPGPEYARHPPGAQGHHAYKPQQDHKHQDQYRDEYGRSRAPLVNARYPPSQENLAHYSQQYQQYPPRSLPESDARKGEQPHMMYPKPSSRDPSPGHKYNPSEVPRHPGYPPYSHPSSSKAPQHPGYPQGPGPAAGGEPSQYSLPAKSSYSPYDRPPEKQQQHHQQPSVISNAYSSSSSSSSSRDERAGPPRAVYPESRPAEHYPPVSQYQTPPQPKPYPQPPRDPNWHYQQAPHHGQPPQAPQPGPSGYGPERPPMRDERQAPVIQPPMSKNIPVKVIATANSVPIAPASSTTIAPATSTTKRESPLDLSVKTVKTKADSTASDDYGHSSRSREVVPKVNFNPNFKKHIPERAPPAPQPAPGPSQSYHVPREPQPIPPPHHPHPHSAKAPSGPPPPDHRQMPVINPAIPPGYDKKTDAYMSANYRAVGGSVDARYPHDSRYAPQGRPDDRRDHPVPYGIPPGAYPGPGPYPQRLPPGAPVPQHPYQLGPAPPKSEPYYPSGAKQAPSVSSRSVYYPPHETARSSKQQPPSQKSHMDDPRIEDRKFVESMLKKQASPSAEVIADLQAGKFSTRLPSTLAPAKKRPAETVPKTSPTKVARVEEPSLHRPYESNYRHPQYPGPAAPRDYYPVPIKHEPASPQPAGTYYSAEKRPEMPSITRGVLNTAQTHPSVLQPNVQRSSHPIDTHPSVITSYHAAAAASRPIEEHPRPSYSHLEERGQPFRHGDPKYYGAGPPPTSVEKPSPHPADRPDVVNQTSVLQMQSHIQYGGQLPPQQQQQQPPMHYKRPEVVQQLARPTNIVENHQARSYENIPRLISDAPKVSPDQRPTPPYHHSSQESLSPSGPSPQHRGADQSVISKLRNSLELKEQRNNQLRKQTSSEMSEEDNKPMDLNAFPPSHFRSKGAMKAYTPIPAFDAPQEQPQEQAPKPPSPVKQEPVEIPKEPIEPPADIEGASALDILDWGSACNEFVEQLQTGKKRGRRKRCIGAKRDNEAAALNDGFRADLPGTANSTLSEVPQEVLKSAAQEIGDFASSSDEDKPLVVLKQQQQSGTEDQLLAIRNSTMEKLTEKIARNMREKQRLEQEQRHEAKLGRSSSSESESDNRRVVQRAKMRARKLRNRQSVPLKSSDVNTDGEDEEEEEDQARDLRKRKKLDQTSSESEPEAQSKKLNRCQTQQIKQENGTDMSTDEEDPKTQSPGGKKDKRLEVKSENVKQGRTASDSESNDVKTNESGATQAKNCKAEPQTSGSESEKSEAKPKKRGPKKFAKPRTTSRSKVVEESSESEESSDEAETMTRSRSKLVLEKQKSNSKVLRNDKIVGNFVKDRKRHDSVTPQKGKKGMVNVKLEASKKRILDSDSDGKSVAGKKRIRKTSKLQTTSASDSSEESEAGHRLRTRKQKASESSAPSSATKRGTSQDGKGKGLEKKGVKSDPPKKRGRQPKKTSKDCATENTSENFYPGWEKELYEFKRSLKVPPQLITIGGRQYVHRISASLPDLDSHHSGDESETFSEIVKKINQKDAERVGKKVKTKAAAKHGAKNKEQQVEERKIEGNMKFSSIIELLHERMLRQRKLMAKGKKGKKGDDKDAVKVKSEFELLPTPGAESEALFNRKKKSLFDTAIFKSRTRTEQKVMQSKEIIREVFGGDDERPQSAPPLGCVKDLKNVTFDEVYNEMLNKTEHVASFLAQKKLQRDKAVASTSGGQSAVKVKIEDLDDETQDSVLKDSGRVTEEGDTPSVVSERDLATPVSFRGVGKKKTHKSRRKGSSGFDYIRKKKKPVPVNNGEHSTPVVPKKKIISAFENLQTKDESHINKEIRSWVLNKGVGESVMHKAARLGYTDVIVYCLERLEMDPDLKDNAGYTPLHEACAKGHLDICNYLLQYGASHSETAPSGIRPLHEAVENSFIEVVRLLLAFGADPMLATYAGQTPIQLAENNEMALFLENHLIDIQSLSSTKTGWKMDGSWKAHDFEESGCDLFADIPDFPHDESHNNSTTTERSSLSSSGQSTSEHCPPPPPPPPPSSQSAAKRCDSNSNIMNFEVPSVKSEEYGERKYKDCAVVLNDIHLNGATATPYLNGQIKQVNGRLSEEESDGDGELGGEFVFEYEEADRPLPPLYLLKDDTAGDKWVLMTDLCNFLKLKSKEAVMKQICPNPPANATTNNGGTTTAISPPSNGTTTVVSSRELIRELKLEDFLTRASCLQLLCAGEKLNIHSNKVVLVKYNDNVRNLLQVQSHVAKI